MYSSNKSSYWLTHWVHRAPPYQARIVININPIAKKSKSLKLGSYISHHRGVNKHTWHCVCACISSNQITHCFDKRAACRCVCTRASIVCTFMEEGMLGLGTKEHCQCPQLWKCQLCWPRCDFHKTQMMTQCGLITFNITTHTAVYCVLHWEI